MPAEPTTPKKKSFEQIKEEIKKQVDELPGEIEKLQNESPNDPSKGEKATKLSSKLEALKTVDKLTKFTESLSKNGDDNILVNLCSGLQTFLGFNSTSKGYDGTGIVYSDVDRLCDGVMGFLSGVLGAVKDDPSVKTYTLITELDLNKISDNMHNGVYGFGVCIDHVRNILHDYVAELHKRIDAIQKPLVCLLYDITKHQNTIYRENHLEIADQINTWELRAEGYIKQAKEAGNALTQIDAELSGKLMCNVKSVLQATESFQEAVSNRDLDCIRAFAFDTTVKVIGRVENKFSAYIQRIQDYLTGRLMKLGEKLDKMRDTQFGQLLATLYDELAPAFVTVDRGLANLVATYKGEVAAKLRSIRDASELFNKKFAATKEELLLTIGRVSTDIDYIEELSRIAQFTDVSNDVPLLTAIGKKEKTFEKLSDYFAKINTVVMTPLQGAMEKIKNAMVSSVNQWSMEDAVKTAKSELIQLQDGLGGTGPDTGTIKQLKQLLGLSQTDNPHGTLTAHSQSIVSIVEKLNTGPAHAKQILKDEASKLLSDLGIISKEVAAHFAEVVRIVLPSFEEKVRIEVETVAKQLGSKLDMIAKAINNDDSGDGNVDYGGSYKDNVRGIAKLVTEFKMLINDELTNLSDRVGTVSDGVSGKSLYSVLQKLRVNVDELGAAVLKVKQKTEDLRAEIDACCTETAKIFHEAPATSDEIMSELRDDVNWNIKSAFSELQDKTKDVYAARKNVEINALKKIVGGQLHRIRQIIEKDNKNGLKGLLKWMNNGIYLDEANTTMLTTLRNAIPQSGEKAAASQQNLENHMKLQKMLQIFRAYGDMIFEYICSQFKTPGTPMKPTEQSTKIANLNNSFDTLLSYIVNTNIICHFDNVSTKYLRELNDSIHSLTPTLSSATSALDPQALPDAGRPVLRALQQGMMGFVGELGKGYVNRYDGGETIKEWVKRDDGKDVLTPEGKNGAKVFLTLLETLNEDLKYLRDQCDSEWSSKQIHSVSSLGGYLQRCGYTVSNRDKQDGELRRSSEMKGSNIIQKVKATLQHANKIQTHLQKCESNELVKKTQEKKQDNFHIFDLLKCLHSHLDDYYSVCHMATFASKKQPCSVYEMLLWLSGLPHNNVYRDLGTDGFDELFDKKDDAEPDSFDFDNITIENETPNVLTAYPQRIRRGDITSAIVHLTSYAPTVLTTILGTGDKFTTYAVDFRTNHLNFSYPSRAEDCLHALLDILRRIFPPLKFLHSQCDTLTSEHGWYRCKYGKDVQSAKSPCTKHSKSEPECQPRSPLMSFLGDCLPGHLPHHLTSVGCKAECKTCPKVTPGQPCLTPLGFRGFSGSTKLGKELGNVLTKFFGNGVASCLFSVIPKPPSDLSEHFSYALTIVKRWDDHAKKPFKDEVAKSIKGMSIGLYANTDDLTNAIRDAYHKTHTAYNDKNHLPAYADLLSTAMPTPCTANDVKCAPYLRSVCSDFYYYYAYKHCSTYMSWAIYLPWQFWSLLNDLYNAFCSINCQDWGCRGCLRGDKCKKGEHGVIDEEKKSAICQCPSIVDCKGVAPTLYQYGFVFGEASTLNGESPKKCSDFCSQLKNVLKSKYFEKLFEECDNFLWKIREPFSYLVLALWLLSLLYLLHIMVIRLDLLHIKSHLHSPSSHRIAAQSLLAASRVNKLNRVFYLQP